MMTVPRPFEATSAEDRPVTFTIQGVLEDAGSANSTGFSVTNAVILIVQ
ncbi:MAG: hypothetical protein HYR85_19935 [Planctomycetes bacterium]|nr:hypothetical protein [Planctomycetota bacterium]MBI3844500.1 hypothetical protein [Planctomycetota bacterium]